MFLRLFMKNFVIYVNGNKILSKLKNVNDTLNYCKTYIVYKLDLILYFEV